MDKGNLVDTFEIFYTYETTVRCAGLNNTTHNKSHKIYKIKVCATSIYNQVPGVILFYIKEVKSPNTLVKDSITIYSKFNFAEHVSPLCEKASQKLNALAGILLL